MTSAMPCKPQFIPAKDCYDEAFGPDGKPRAHYASAFKHLESLGFDELGRRRFRLKSVLQDNDLVSTARKRGRSDGMDSLPLFIGPDEWAKLETGLRQRIRLFNAIAIDAYGPQNLWRKGILPPALLHLNTGFVQAVWGYAPPSKVWTHLLGTEVRRMPDGSFAAVSDQLQTPDGIGKALENRIASSRAFPELFRELRTERLARFFKALQDSLEGLAEGKSWERRAVLLASPPEFGRRAEDAILSRYLGIQLVENDDLSIRRQQVFLKTLAGLKRVDSIFRRMDAGLCDPLELRIDSGEGCAGLIMAIRAGNVSIANALGAGILEAPLLRAYLPKISKTLLGEELLLQSPPVRWLDEKAAWEDVSSNPGDYLFAPAFSPGPAQDYAALTPVAQLGLLDEIAKAPGKWIAERRSEGSCAPAWTGDAWRLSKASFKFYTMLRLDGEAQAMPGGLGRYSLIDDPSARRGEKDVWILSKKPVPFFSLLAPVDQPVRLSRAGGDLPSRTADGLYNLGRNVEAADALSRLARGIALRLTDQSIAESPELPALLQAGSAAYDGHLQADPENALWSLVMRQDNEAGIQKALAEVRRLATQLRDRVSEDTWRLIHNFGEQSRPDGQGPGPLLPYLSRIIGDSLAFSGLAGESMTRGHGWRFQEMGRRIERAQRALALLKATLACKIQGDLAEVQLLQALLEIGDSTMTYHRRYGGRIQAAPVADLFLCDETNPRSVAFQTLRLAEEAEALPPQSGEEAILSPMRRELLRLQTELRLADIHALSQDLDGRRDALARSLGDWMASFERVADLLSRNYLSHAPQKAWPETMATEV